MRKNLPACAFVLTVLVCPSYPQQNAGSLRGTVRDQLGGLIVKATVVMRDAKGVEKTVTTNSIGNYEFKALPPGNYDLQVVAPGFEVFEENNLQVQAGRITTFDLQLEVALEKQSVIVDEEGISTDPDRNADALILRGSDLDSLPTDPQALAAALQAMAGPSDGQTGAQIIVDGFSGGQIPPKEAIREVRINQNPFSAENEYPGYGGIQIYTQPGSAKFTGGASFEFSDESLNSRNAFTPVRASYQQRAFNGNLSGPIISKRASFSFYVGRYASDSNSDVNATILDPVTLDPLSFTRSFLTPQVSHFVTARGDLKVNNKHTLIGSYRYSDSSQDLQGIGGFSLPSRAFRGSRQGHTLQVTETAVLNETTINETRLQIIHNSFQQVGDNTLPALNVLDSFFGGGSQTGFSSTRDNRFELQNFISHTAGTHSIKIGGRIRYVGIRSVSPANFGGTYMFGGGVGPRLDANNQVITGDNGQPEMIEISSLERYRRTLLFTREGLSPTQIRSLGGGATQFSIAGGNPEAKVSQFDVGLYIQNDWKLRPNFTLSPGLRYENQNNVDSSLNFAPRIAFAWSPLFRRKPDSNSSQGPTQAPTRPGPPKTVIRGGFGVFYSRISEGLSLQALRFNGINQRQFVVSDPVVLDLFPVVPEIETLDAFSQPQTRRFFAPDLRPSYSLRSSISLERQLPHNLRLTFNYWRSHTLRTLRTVNINAPLPSGVRPLDQNAGNILEYQSTGRSVAHGFSVNINGRIRTLNFASSYSLGKTKTTDSGTSGSNFDPYDFSNEWGRASFDIRHFAYLSASYQAPFGVRFNTFLITNSGSPFDITTGRDRNRDTFFTERPAFATDLTKPGVVITSIGAFDPNPEPGQRIIPRNFGQGPGYLLVNTAIDKVFRFGRVNSPPAAGPPQVSETPSGQRPPPQQKPYQIGLSIYAVNVLNHTNRGNPVGNLASPLFLKSTVTSSRFFFGPGGAPSGNRQLMLRIRVGF